MKPITPLLISHATQTVIGVWILASIARGTLHITISFGQIYLGATNGHIFLHEHLTSQKFTSPLPLWLDSIALFWLIIAVAVAVIAYLKTPHKEH